MTTNLSLYQGIIYIIYDLIKVYTIKLLNYKHKFFIKVIIMKDHFCH